MSNFIGKYLIVSLKGHEIVDFLNPNAKSQLSADNVPRVDWATGGLLQNSPIVCGGRDKQLKILQDCVVIGQEWRFFSSLLNFLNLGFALNRFLRFLRPEIRMIEKKINAASVALDQSTLWIVGGRDEFYNALTSTELIKLGQPSVKGSELPFKISEHSMIQYDEKSIYIIGGYQNGSLSKKTWIVNPKNGFEIKEGPSLNKARFGHGCAKMALNGRTILNINALVSYLFFITQLFLPF